LVIHGTFCHYVLRGHHPPWSFSANMPLPLLKSALQLSFFVITANLSLSLTCSVVVVFQSKQAVFDIRFVTFLGMDSGDKA